MIFLYLSVGFVIFYTFGVIFIHSSLFDEEDFRKQRELNGELDRVEKARRNIVLRLEKKI